MASVYEPQFHNEGGSLNDVIKYVEVGMKNPISFYSKNVESYPKNIKLRKHY